LGRIKIDDLDISRKQFCRLLGQLTIPGEGAPKFPSSREGVPDSIARLEQA